MSDNEKQSQLYTLVELLFMPMAFYVLAQFDKINSLPQGVLWFVIFILVQNEYVSIKVSSPNYNLGLYLLDLISLFVYLFALKALFTPKSIIGYDPLFWIYISILWLGYAIWDWIMIYHEEDSLKKDEYRRFRSNMIACFLITILCGFALLIVVTQPTSPNKKIIVILHLLLGGCFVWALGGWWLQSLFSKSKTEQAG